MPGLRLYHYADIPVFYLWCLNSICWIEIAYFCKASFTVWIFSYAFVIEYFIYFQWLINMARPLHMKVIVVAVEAVAGLGMAWSMPEAEGERRGAVPVVSRLRVPMKVVSARVGCRSSLSDGR
jgi:hypothetical protein